jgi:hypothetical protein
MKTINAVKPGGQSHIIRIVAPMGTPMYPVKINYQYIPDWKKGPNLIIVLATLAIRMANVANTSHFRSHLE